MIARVPSLSDPAVAYDLVLRKDGSIACGCPAFGSWKKRGLPCWHMRVYQSAEGAVERCRKDHGRDGDICLVCLLRLLAQMAGVVKRKYVPRPPKKPRKKKGDSQQ